MSPPHVHLSQWSSYYHNYTNDASEQHRLGIVKIWDCRP